MQMEGKNKTWKTGIEGTRRMGGNRKTGKREWTIRRSGNKEVEKGVGMEGKTQWTRNAVMGEG